MGTTPNPAGGLLKCPHVELWGTPSTALLPHSIPGSRDGSGMQETERPPSSCDLPPGRRSRQVARHLHPHRVTAGAGTGAVEAASGKRGTPTGGFLPIIRVGISCLGTEVETTPTPVCPPGLGLRGRGDGCLTTAIAGRDLLAAV